MHPPCKVCSCRVISTFLWKCITNVWVKTVVIHALYMKWFKLCPFAPSQALRSALEVTTDDIICIAA